MVAMVITLLVVLFFLSEGLTASMGKHLLRLSPLDEVVCTDQSVTFTCSLLAPPVSNASIGFQIVQSRRWETVSAGDILVVNETMSKFTFDVSSNKDYQYIRCYYGKVLSSSLRSSITTLSVYNRPEEVRDFKCIVHNYIQSMRCFWNYGIRYKATPRVTFQWMNPRWGSWQECAHLDAAGGKCSWRSVRDGDFTMQNLVMRILLSQRCGINVSSTFEVDTSKLVKPGPVADLSAAVLNSTCIKLSWKTTDARPEYPKQHFVSLSSRWGDNDEEGFTTAEETVLVEKLYCELRPFTKYTFSVYMKPIHGPYSSDVRTVEATTFSDKPSASPEVTNGGYMWNPRDCKKGSQRTVCLLWKTLEEIDMNGVLRSYDITFTPVISPEEHGNVTLIEADPVGDGNGRKVFEANRTYGCSPLLQCNTSYMVNIVARNDNGTSEKASSIKIASADFEIVQPRFIVEMGNITDGICDVHVTRPPRPRSLDQQPSNLTIFWCRKHRGDCKSTSSADWQTSGSDTNETILQITTPEEYVYGVSMTSQNGSSGFEWQSCIYTKYTVPKEEPENVLVLPGHDENTVLVVWSKLRCESGAPLILSYIVQYCSNGECKEEEVLASYPGWTVLRGLNGDRTYAVTVRGVSKDGLEGPKSQVVYGAVRAWEHIRLGQGGVYDMYGQPNEVI